MPTSCTFVSTSAYYAALGTSSFESIGESLARQETKTKTGVAHTAGDSSLYYSLFVIFSNTSTTAAQTFTRQSKTARNESPTKKLADATSNIYRYKPVLFIYRAEDYSRNRNHVFPVKHGSPTRYAYFTAAGARDTQSWHMSTASNSVRWSCVPMLQIYLHLRVLCGTCTCSLEPIPEPLARLFARQITNTPTGVV